MFVFLTGIKMTNNKFELRDALFQAYMKEAQLSGTDIDPFQVDRKANNYIIHNAN